MSICKKQKPILRYILLVSAVLLTSCTYNLALMQRGSGDVANGTADRMSHSVTITLKGKVYKEQYPFVQAGAFGTSSAFGSGGYAVSNMSMVSSIVTGTILARSPDGSGLRCEFSYSGTSGIGVCQDDNKNTYDLQISRY